MGPVCRADGKAACGTPGHRVLALLATVTFLRANGREFVLTNNQVFDLVMAVAEGSLGPPEIAERLSAG